MNNNPADLILTLEAACRFRESLRREGKRLVVTTGCFDRLPRDGGVIFDGARCDRELVALAADCYVKGGDYTREKLDPAERAALENAGTEICFKPFIPDFSTTTIIARIRETL